MRIKQLLTTALAFAIGLTPCQAWSETSNWRKWKEYRERQDYGQVFVYLDLKNKSKLKDAPWIYRVNKRLREEGWNPNTPLVLFVDCRKKQTKTVGEDHQNKWFQAKDIDSQIVRDVCS